jgi:hypothetical protein
MSIAPKSGGFKKRYAEGQVNGGWPTWHLSPSHHFELVQYPQQNPTPYQPIYDLQENDFVSGKGTRWNLHEPNVRFRLWRANKKEDYMGGSQEDRQDITSVLTSKWKHQSPTGRYLKKWFIDGEGRAVYREMTEQEVNNTIHRFFGRPNPNPGAARAAVEALGQEVANDDPDTDDIEGDDEGIDEDDEVQFNIACWREMNRLDAASPDPTDWAVYEAIADEVVASAFAIGGMDEPIAAAQYAWAAAPATGQISEEAHDPIKQFNVPSICPPVTPQYPPRASLSEDDGDMKPVRLL